MPALNAVGTPPDAADTVREGQEQGEGGRALRVSYTQAPQDGSADAVLDVVLQPSYVHYSAATTDRVLGFFKTPQVGRCLARMLKPGRPVDSLAPACAAVKAAGARRCTYGLPV